MGPRLGRRGELYYERHAVFADKCFNGATARSPWRTKVTAELDPEALVASMGPRLGRRGERRRPNNPAGQPACASMGPRLGRRGERVAGQPAVPPCRVLQW